MGAWPAVVVTGVLPVTWEDEQPLIGSLIPGAVRVFRHNLHHTSPPNQPLPCTSDVGLVARSRG